MKKIIFKIIFILSISSFIKKSTIEAHPKKEGYPSGYDADAGDWKEEAT